MKFRRSALTAAIGACSLALALAVTPAAGAATPVPTSSSAAAPGVPAGAHSWRHPGGHAVFVQTNDPVGNAIISYARDRDGRLHPAGRYATGGLGGSEVGAVVDPLASQGSLTYDRAHHLLYAVNAGSGTVTVFAVRGDRLHRVQVLPSGGGVPVSVSVSGDLVYVLDAGGDGAVTGFRVLEHRLVPIPGSTRSLGLGNPADPQFLRSPSQVAITPDRSAVIVATKTHGTLQVFPLDRDGRPAAAAVTTPAGVVPFALSFDHDGRLEVADASGGAYSFTVHRDGTLTPVSPFVANGQAATCWSVSVGHHLFVANAGSATISGYQVGRSGVLTLLGGSGVAARTDAGPVDLAASSDGRYLYQQATGAGTIDEFRIGAGGSLTRIGTVTFGPADDGTGAEGIAAS